MADQVFIITGSSGVGKTSVCAQVVSLLKEEGLDVQGVVTLPRMSGGRKVGMDVQDVRTGEIRALADVRAADRDRPGAMITENWRFRGEGVSWGAGIIESADPHDILVLDEIGPVELLRGQGWTVALDRVRDATCPVALVVVRPSLVERFCQEIGRRQAKSILVTAGNRDGAARHLVDEVLAACRTHTRTG